LPDAAGANDLNNLTNPLTKTLHPYFSRAWPVRHTFFDHPLSKEALGLSALLPKGHSFRYVFILWLQCTISQMLKWWLDLSTNLTREESGQISHHGNPMPSALQIDWALQPMNKSFCSIACKGKL